MKSAGAGCCEGQMGTRGCSPLIPLPGPSSVPPAALPAMGQSRGADPETPSLADGRRAHPGVSSPQGPLHSPLDSTRSTRHHGLVERVQRDPRRMMSPLRRYVRQISFIPFPPAPLAGGRRLFLPAAWAPAPIPVAPVLVSLGLASISKACCPGPSAGLRWVLARRLLSPSLSVWSLTCLSHRQLSLRTDLPVASARAQLEEVKIPRFLGSRHLFSRCRFPARCLPVSAGSLEPRACSVLKSTRRF